MHHIIKILRYPNNFNLKSLLFLPPTIAQQICKYIIYTPTPSATSATAAGADSAAAAAASPGDKMGGHIDHRIDHDRSRVGAAPLAAPSSRIIVGVLD